MSITPDWSRTFTPRLTARFTEMISSRDWLDYLAAARRFHRYSPNNQLLLALQGAQGHVASYGTWQRIPAEGGGTCQVAKGQSGLMILAPLTARTVDVDVVTGEETDPEQAPRVQNRQGVPRRTTRHPARDR